MSAFVVSDEHINYMLNAFLQYCTRGLDPKELQPIGVTLREENNRSVGYLYNGRHPDMIGEPYSAPFRFAHVDPVITLKAINCYVYQSCEHPSWGKTEAKKFCDALQSAAIAQLPGYNDAPWGIDEWQPKKITAR